MCIVNEQLLTLPYPIQSKSHEGALRLPHFSLSADISPRLICIEIFVCGNGVWKEFVAADCGGLRSRRTVFSGVFASVTVIRHTINLRVDPQEVAGAGEFAAMAPICTPVAPGTCSSYDNPLSVNLAAT
ncbi:unnamed protein product, partial [Iphiclides podalirius]